jgi:hypothetical protein
MNGELFGSDPLSADAARVLREKAPEIADTLGVKAVEGHGPSLKSLNQLSGKHKEEQAILELRHRPKRSLATEWMNEAEWTEEDERAAQAETQHV